MEGLNNSSADYMYIESPILYTTLASRVYLNLRAAHLKYISYLCLKKKQNFYFHQMLSP